MKTWAGGLALMAALAAIWALTLARRALRRVDLLAERLAVRQEEEGPDALG